MAERVTMQFTVELEVDEDKMGDPREFEEIIQRGIEMVRGLGSGTKEHRFDEMDMKVTSVEFEIAL